MGIDTKIILISCIVTEILTKEGFSIIAALICILGGLPKDDRVASFRFLKSTPPRYRNSEKLCTDGIARFSKNLGIGNRTNGTYRKAMLRIFLEEQRNYQFIW